MTIVAAGAARRRRSVVLALADPDADSAAVEFAFADADRQNGTLVVIRVAHGPHATGKEADALQTRLRPGTTAIPPSVKIRVERGPRWRRCSAPRTGPRGDHDPGRGAIAGAVLDSASHALVKLSTCPVTIVPRSFTTAGHAAAPTAPEAAR